MKFSFVVPAYNEAHYIRFLLQSIFEHARGYDSEVIVVDNASTDNTVEVVKKSFPQVKIVFEKNKGTGFARNAGAAHANGDIIIFFDSDIVMSHFWIPTMLSLFNSDKNLVAVSGPYYHLGLARWQRFFEKAYYYLGIIPHQWFFSRVMRKGGILIGGNIAVRKKIFNEVGGFDPALTFWGDDTMLAKRLIKKGNIVFSNKLFVYASSRRIMRSDAPWYKNAWIGVLVVLSYLLNFYWVIFFNKPVFRKFKDIR